VTKVLFAGIVAICFVGLSAERAFAQSRTATFMLVPGIPGDSSHERYDGWIDVLSLTQTFDPIAKSGNVCSLAIHKRLDSAGPRLWAAAVTGQLFSQIQVDIVKEDDRPTKIYEILLVNARVASIMSMEGGEGVIDSLTITADSVGLKFMRQNADGSIGQPITASFSCK